MSWTRAISASELRQGQLRAVTLDGERLLLCRLTDDDVYAVADSCSHDDGPLSEGRLEGAQIECPRHGARFDIRTGAALRMPAAAPIEAYPTRLNEGWVEVDLEAPL